MDNGAIITRVEPFGADGYGPRKLAYRIRKNQVNYTTAFYVNVCAFATPQTLTEVERRLKLDERVLRHLTVRKSLEAATKPLPDIDRVLQTSNLDESDPQFALQKFLTEYARENPDGTKFTAEEDTERVSDDIDDNLALKAVIENLRAATPQQGEEDTGFKWIVDHDPQRPSGPGRTS